MNNCRTITIGVAALAGVALWIVLALGTRGWFSSLLIAALLAAAGALIVLALVCPGMEAEAVDEPETPERQKPVTRPDTATPVDAAIADAGGREAESVEAPAKDETRLNDTAVLDDDTDATSADEADVASGDDAGDDKDTSGDLGDEVARTEKLDRAASRPETVSPEMPDGVAAGLRETPELLDAPRGEADDLKRLRGVGPKLEDQLNRLGVWHLSQIASWSEGEAAWIDDHLEGFKGRILRDDWIGQARELTGKA
ncbi:hypothetical protein [Limimaricola litoreus]|uniref:NADH-quinone oxidoreductase subunit E n=1 Tax=Limimaricola litoreus TaxID=2955316 RepID=A0A9X2FUN8_9RHOB|nr:hypothetical protein [Limimaricola litoreus]MCP1167508.1 hypothetical protein [Limimaricola litoreus]